MEQNVIVFVPALVDVLFFEEKNRGHELSQEEVEEIKDNAVCMVVSAKAAADLDKDRGYEDIRPEHAWEDWLANKKDVEDSGPQPPFYFT
jgi:hypothetical protein